MHDLGLQAVWVLAEPCTLTYVWIVYYELLYRDRVRISRTGFCMHGERFCGLACSSLWICRYFPQIVFCFACLRSWMLASTQTYVYIHTRHTCTWYEAHLHLLCWAIAYMHLDTRCPIVFLDLHSRAFCLCMVGISAEMEIRSIWNSPYQQGGRRGNSPPRFLAKKVALQNLCKHTIQVPQLLRLGTEWVFQSIELYRSQQ